MSQDVLLISNQRDSSKIVAEAVARSGRQFHQFDDCRGILEELIAHQRELSAIIIDVDPEAHGLAILEAISTCEQTPPIIFVTSLENAYMTPVAFRHGATACLAKPFTARELAALLNQVCAGPARVETSTCDRWGHPQMMRRTFSHFDFSGAVRKCA